MAGTISVDVSVQAANGVWELPFSRSFVIDQTNPGSHDPLHYLTTTPEVIDTGELASPGLVILFNIGANPIVWGPQKDDALVPLGQIEAGRCAVYETFAGAVLMAKAASGEAVLWPLFLEK